MKVIGFSGKARHGKDTCAGIVRDIAENDFGLRTIIWNFGHSLKARAFGAAAGNLSFEDVWFNKPDAVRDLLQQEGTEKGRKVYGDDFWMLHTEAFIRLFEEGARADLVIIPDVRFPNEVEFIHYGGRAVSVLRDKMMVEARKAQGITPEMEDYLLHNDPAGLLALETTIENTYIDLMEYEYNRSEGRCYRIKSDRPTLTGKAAEHTSETALDNYPDDKYSGIIHNNLTETFADLAIQLRACLNSFLTQGSTYQVAA